MALVLFAGAHVRVDRERDIPWQHEAWTGQVVRVERVYGDLIECSWQPSPLRPRRRRMLLRSDLGAVGSAEHVLRTCVERGNLVVVGIPQEFPSAQEPRAVVVRMDVACPAGAGEAEGLFRDLISPRGLRIIGVPEVSPSTQDPGIVLLRVEVRVPASLVEEQA